MHYKAAEGRNNFTSSTGRTASVRRFKDVPDRPLYWAFNLLWPWSKLFLNWWWPFPSLVLCGANYTASLRRRRRRWFFPIELGTWWEIVNACNPTKANGTDGNTRLQG